MNQIILSPDQAKLYHQATAPVQVCDTRGKILGTPPPDYSAEFIAALKRRAREPGRGRYSSEQGTRRMQALAKSWDRDGPFDKKRLLGVFEQIHAEDTR